MGSLVKNVIESPIPNDMTFYASFITTAVTNERTVIFLKVLFLSENFENR